MSPRWLLAAALIAAPRPAFSEEAGVPDPSPDDGAPAAVDPAALLAGGKKGGRLEVDGAYSFRDNGRTMVAIPDNGRNPVLYFKDVRDGRAEETRIEAQNIAYDTTNKTLSAEGEVKVDFSRIRILADGVTYRANLRNLQTGRVRLGTPPALIEAAKVDITSVAKGSVDTTTATLGVVKFYYNEPDLGVFSLSASKLRYDSASQILRADDVTFRIGPVPILYLPSWEQEGLDLPPFDPDLQVGSNNRYGAFLRTTTFYTGKKSWQPGLLLDGYGKAGVLAGPAIRYDTFKAKPGDAPDYTQMKGDFRAGFIEDNSARGLDEYNRPIPEDRYFVEWKHKQTIADTLEVTGSLHWWSDDFVVRDFRRRFYDNNQKPDNFFEIVYPDRDFYASVFTRFDPNDFQDVNQRLPEVRFDLNPREIGDTRIYQRGYISVAYLREEVSPEVPVLPGTLDDELATPRIDAYYGFSRPINPSSAFGITPVAGVRSTTWFDALNGDPTYSRLAGQVGFDAQSLARGRWDYDNASWDIQGLRHQLRPLVQYRYLPGVTDGSGRIPQIDRYTFLTAPPPIDLSQRRDTDEMHETQILRLGLENLFQTRDKVYGSKDLMGLDIYQDIRQTDQTGQRTLSDTYIREKLTPAAWLDFEIFQRINPYTGALDEFSTQTTLLDGDRWKLIFGTQHVSDELNVDQYLVAWEYRISSEYTLKALWRYDADAGLLAEQTYGVVQQLGHTWQLEYTVGYNQNAREDSGFNFGIRLRLNTF